MLLTFPQPPQKNVPATVSLDVGALLQLPQVSADDYFSDIENVDFVLAVYDSEVGNQKEFVRFRLSEGETDSIFFVSDRARDVFLLERVILCDFDNGTLTIERSELPMGLDVSFA